MVKHIDGVSTADPVYPVENSPVAKAQEDVHALMLSTFHGRALVFSAQE